jgi:hypothetical protein
MSVDAHNEVNVLKLTIHGVLIGYLTGFKNGRNVLSASVASRRVVGSRSPGIDY